MNSWLNLSRILMAGGALMMALGALIYLMQRYQIKWHLPGDIVWQKGNFTFFFPVVTCIVISILLTVMLNLFWRR